MISQFSTKSPRHGSTDAAKNSERTKETPTLEEILNWPRAREWRDRLIKGGLKPDHLKYFLFEMARAPNKIVNRNPARLAVAALARKCRALADEIERTQPTASFFIFPASNGRIFTAIPNSLRAYATACDTTLSLFKGPHGATARAEAIAAFLEIVKFETGRYHFPEVADLVNASLWAHGKSSRWHPSSLKQLMLRARRRWAKLTKR